MEEIYVDIYEKIEKLQASADEFKKEKKWEDLYGKLNKLASLQNPKRNPSDRSKTRRTNQNKIVVKPFDPEVISRTRAMMDLGKAKHLAAPDDMTVYHGDERIELEWENISLIVCPKDVCELDTSLFEVMEMDIVSQRVIDIYSEFVK